MLQKPLFTQFLRNRPQTTSVIQSNTSFYRPNLLKSFPTSFPIFSWEQWEFWEHDSFPFHFQQLTVHLTVPTSLNTPWDRWELAEQIGHGIYCWQVSPLSIGPNGKQSTPPAVYLLYGCFEKFIFPSSVDSVFELSKDIREWREKRNTDPATLLSFLKILSQHEASKKLPEPPFLRAKTVLEAEKLCIEGEILTYLRQFSSTNSEDHPLSRSQLLNLIDTFLNMLDINITRTIAKRKEAKQLIQATAPNFDVHVRDKEIAVEWMRKEWAQDDKLSQDTIIDRLVLAIRRAVKLTDFFQIVL